MRDPIIRTFPLGFPWQTVDPFLFCVHHLDLYPAGNERLGPQASLAGRRLGEDFAGIDGWRMYHGDVVPGFPQHPHRGFETVTITRRGYIDHADSLGATARYGRGDVQWLTAAGGVVHSEMFPLLHRDRDNPAELFQIWLNLPARAKLADPRFVMFWSQHIPRVVSGGAEATLIAGTLGGQTAPPPPPDSWAAQPESDLAIWSLRVPAGAALILPAARPGTRRTLYFFAGGALRLGEQVLRQHAGIEVHADQPVALAAEEGAVEVLVLQGRPIGEPVVQHGPFVMNSPEEVQRAFSDYRRTGFGGWPWPVDGPVHGPEARRFARYADGRTEEAPPLPEE